MGGHIGKSLEEDSEKGVSMPVSSYFFFSLFFFFLQDIYPAVGIDGSYVVLFLVFFFFEETLYCFL